MIGTAFSVLILVKLVHLVVEYRDSISIIDPLKEALLSFLEFVHILVSPLKAKSLLVPFLLSGFTLYYLSITNKQYSTYALSLTNNDVSENVSVFGWFKYNIDILIWKLGNSRIPFLFILYVVAYVLHLYITIEVAYAAMGPIDEVGNFTDNQEVPKVPAEADNKIGNDVVLDPNTPDFRVQIQATKEMVEEVAKHLPPIEWWNDKAFDSISMMAIWKVAQSVQGGPVAKITTGAGLVTLYEAKQIGLIRQLLENAAYGHPIRRPITITNTANDILNNVHINNGYYSSITKPSNLLNLMNPLNPDTLVAKYRRGQSAVNNSDSTLNSVADPNSASNSYYVLSPLEDTPSFATSIYDYLVSWMKYYSPSRCPSNTDVGLLDCVSSDGISMYSFFSTFNLIVYIIFTVTLYFVLSNFTLFFIKYFSNNFTSWLGKVSKQFSGQSKADLKTVEFTKSLLSTIISINKTVIVCLFIILLVLTTYLHNYYSISTFLSTDFGEILREKYSTSMEVPIEITILGIPVHYFQKVSQVVLGIAFGYYRTYLLVTTLKSSKLVQSLIAIIIAYYFQKINGYILEIVLVDNATTNDIPFITMCEACNGCVKLLFYSLLGVLISVTLQNILFFFKKNVISPDINQPNLEAQNLEYYSPYLFYNIIVIYLKINTSIGIIGAFQAILYLFTHFIPLS